GYENGCTPAILDALKKHNAPACFFVVGNFIDTAPELVKRMAAEGHIVGNHTLHHPDMSGIADKSAFAAELNGLEEKYTALTGQPMQKFYRPPQGKFSEENLRQAQELGYTTVFWSLAYVDWYTDNQPTDEQAFSKLLPRIHNGAIVLLHSTSETNARILDELLTKWESAGIRLVLDGAGAVIENGEWKMENECPRTAHGSIKIRRSAPFLNFQFSILNSPLQ
ncbi:MAG: polysaccharide deacetylase family protein, partial [Butyricicoccus sp.]